MNTVTLIIIPGAGARSLTIQQNTKVSDLVAANNLHGRDIIINGMGITPSTYGSTLIPEGAEIFATGSVKGNGKNSPVNGPSQTGRPSGGGRGNNPSKK